MVVTVADIITRVKSELNRGTTYDSIIPAKIADAIKWIERAHNWKWLDKFVTFTVNDTDTEPRAIALPSGFKKLEFMRIVKADSTFKYMRIVNPRDVSSLAADSDGLPSGVWQDGMDYWWLDATVDGSINFELGYVGYTDVPTDTSKSFYLIDTYPDIVVNQTIMLLAPKLRFDQKTYGLYKSQRDEAMETMQLMDEELKAGGVDDAMTYTGDRNG